MKILFLDIDGVLNSTRYWDDRNRNLPLGKAGALDPVAVERLNAIVDATGCLVVLSSSWRGKGASPSVQGMLRERGFRHLISDSTPYFAATDPKRCERWREIHCWLDVYFLPQDDSVFVVLDDDLDAWNRDSHWAPFGRFVNTNYLVGLQQDGVDLAVAWLGSQKATSVQWQDISYIPDGCVVCPRCHGGGHDDTGAGGCVKCGGDGYLPNNAAPVAAGEQG